MTVSRLLDYVTFFSDSKCNGFIQYKKISLYDLLRFIRMRLCFMINYGLYQTPTDMDCEFISQDS
jgi:hypothetical protein